MRSMMPAAGLPAAGETGNVSVTAPSSGKWWMHMVKNIVSSGVILLACIFFYVLTFRINVVAGFEDMAPSLWPRFNIIGMAVIAFLILVRSLWTNVQSKTPDTASEVRFPLGAMAGSVGILFGFILLTPYLGFLVTAFISTAALMVLLGEKNKGAILLLSFVLVVLIYVVFGKVMSVPIPRGSWIFQEISYLLY